MKLMILCVDGFDPDYARENGFDRFEHSAKLTIPQECYIETGDGPQPATGRVWPSIFSGRAIDHQLIDRKGFRLYLHNLLIRYGAREVRQIINDWLKEKGIDINKRKYTLGGWNENLETVFSGHISFTWNIPTLSTEWIVKFPDLDKLLKFSLIEYQHFIAMTLGVQGMTGAYELAAVYTRIIDVMGHLHRRKDETYFYRDVSGFAWRMAQRQLAKNNHLMVVSDHGIRDGFHTDHAYIGATFPFNAESILDVRSVIEGALK